MRLIVEGAPQNIQFVISICRDKVRRGQLSLTPAAEAEDDGDSKEVGAVDVKPDHAPTPKKKRSK